MRRMDATRLGSLQQPLVTPGCCGFSWGPRRFRAGLCASLPYQLGRVLCLPMRLSINRFLSRALRPIPGDPTTCLRPWRLMHATLFALCFLLAIPTWLLGFPLQLMVVKLRRRWAMTVDAPLAKSTVPCVLPVEPWRWYGAQEWPTFRAGTLNCCMLPEVVSRINHLGPPQRRATQLGRRIVQSQRHSDGSGPAKRELPIRKEFERLDVLCLQEVFDVGAIENFTAQLVQEFPYVVHSAGAEGWSINHFGVNSGLLTASRHPITHVYFHPYEGEKFGNDAMASKGLLCVKFQLPTPTDRSSGKARVGYAFNTHMHADAGERPHSVTHQVRVNDLRQIQECVFQFKQKTWDPAQEDIAVSILAGDFNFDNGSYYDAPEIFHPIWGLSPAETWQEGQPHPHEVERSARFPLKQPASTSSSSSSSSSSITTSALVECASVEDVVLPSTSGTATFADPCRQAPYVDKPWAIGTNVARLWGDGFTDPDSLYENLTQHPDRRRRFVEQAHTKDWGDCEHEGRRLDMILLDQEVHGKDFVQSFDEPREGFMPVDLEVVCVCAGVTDHMGVQIRMPLKL